jgi:hypothetical protein
MNECYSYFKGSRYQQDNGIHNSRCSRDILIDRIYGSSPPSVTVLELNNKKGGCWGILQIP